MQKRGQVTVFIVVGIVILVVFGLVFALRGNILEQSFENEMNSIIVPQQLMPVKSYLDSCLKDVVSDGVRIIGEQGGYIDIPEDITYRSATNPFSNSLQLFGDAEVAYWHYETANEIERQQIPTKKQMEAELEEYVDENFKDCFYFLDSFEEEGFEIDLPKSVNTEISIKDNVVQVKVLSEVLVSLKEVNKNINKHMVIVDSRLGEMYDLAVNVMEKENKDLFLEEKTIDMMVVYDEIPYSMTEFTCERKIWNKNDVVEDMKEIISTNIAALRLDSGSSSSYVVNDNDYFEVDVFKPDYISERFIYSTSWPMEVDVSPTKGDILVGDPLTQEVPEISKFLNLFFCLNNYHFVYDVKYPVLVGFSDENGFSFQFATLVEIDNNQPRESIEVVSYDSYMEFDDNFCNNAVKPVEVTVYEDGFNSLSGASILYKCFSTSCYIGDTGSDGVLNANFPPCLNGFVMAQKEGYEFDGEYLSTNSEESTSVFLSKHYNLGLELVELDLVDGYTRKLGDRQAVIQFENQDNGYITMVTNGDETIKLTNGRYTVTAYLMSEEGLEVDLGSEKFVECVSVPKGGVLGLFFNEDQCFETEMEGGTLTDVIVGGAVFEWNAYIGNADKLTVYVPYDKTPRTQQELMDVFNNLQTNKDNLNFRLPEVE